MTWLRPRITFLRLYSPLVLLVLVGLLFYGQADIEQDRVRVRSQEVLNVGLGAGVLSRTLESVARDLHFLAHHSALRAAVDSPTAGHLQHLAEDLATFSSSKTVYDQMRWIDETGQERVRVDYAKDRPVVVAADKLQDKGNRYYFIDTMKLRPGEVLISPLDLNIEQDKIEVPYKPTVRVATPIVDSRGNKRGIVIINFVGRVMLEALAGTPSTTQGQVMLANGEGYWLKSPNPGEEWGFMFNRTDLSMKARFPEPWARIRATESGQELLADGLWTWQAVYPLLVGQKAPAGGIKGFASTRSESEAKAYVWLTFSHVSRDAWWAMQLAVWRKLAVVAVLLLGLVGLGSWKLARSWTALASAEEDVRRLNADLERQVDERTRDLRDKVNELDQEIRDRQRAEEGQRERESHYRALFNYVPDGILIADEESRYKDANASMCSMLGYTREEIIGLHASDIVTQAEIQHIGPALSAIKSGSNYHREWEFRRKDGSVFPAEVSVAVMPDGNLLGMVRDITDRRQAQEERHLLQFQLQQAQKMESLGSLAGGVAHDMNNVLGAILGLASANVEAQPEGSRARQAFETIIQAAERGGKMVKSMLNFARKSPAEERELDMNMILRDEVRLLERTILSKVHIVLDLAPDLRPSRGDASALTHAFMNLCVNAVDAMPECGTLSLRTRNVDKDWIEVRVEDTGVGMPKEVLEKALDPFFTTKEQGKGKGTGLGLSLVYSTVKAHNGQVEIQSEPGQGTCVRMRFPACEGIPQAPGLDAGPRPEPSHGRLTVLLVDDDELIQRSMQALLGVLGHTTITALNGEEALAKLEAGLQPDVVILDMNMPGLGGTGTLPRLRALRPAVPVLLATGRSDQTVLDLLAAHPFVRLLSKPFSMKELQNYLEPIGKG